MTSKIEHDRHTCVICIAFDSKKEQGEANMSLTTIQTASILDEKTAGRPHATVTTKTVNVTKPATETRKFVTVTIPWESAQYLRDLFQAHVAGTVTLKHFSPIDDALYNAGVTRKHARNTNRRTNGVTYSSGFSSAYAVLEEQDNSF